MRAGGENVENFRQAKTSGYMAISVKIIVTYSGKISWGSIFTDGRSLQFHGSNFRRCVHSHPLCAVQLSLFRGFKFEIRG